MKKYQNIKIQLFSILTGLGFVLFSVANGQTWNTVGSAGFSAGEANWTSIVINGSCVPYVGYQDGGNGDKATVMKYNGSSWIAVGSAGFSAGSAWCTSLAIDGSGAPHVVYVDTGARKSLKQKISTVPPLIKL